MYAKYLQLTDHGSDKLIAAELEEWWEVSTVFEHMRHLPYPLLLESTSSYQTSEFSSPQSSAARYSFATAQPDLIFSAVGTEVTVFNQHTNETTHSSGRILDVAWKWLENHPTLRLEDSHRGPTDLPPFLGGLAGFIGYNYGALTENADMRPQSRDIQIPDVLLGAYTWTTAWDHAERKCWIVAPESQIRRLTELLFQPFITPSSRHSKDSYSSHTRIISSFSHPEYLNAIESTQDYIRAGDIFQANITQRFSTDFFGSPWELYTTVRDSNPAPFASYFDFEDAQIVSVSPERFLKLDTNRKVETRPIKGTRPRGRSQEADLALCYDLLQNEKDKAEHVMIVDVLRNDISRVCEYGSVRVPILFKLETHPTVHHLVSIITGQMREDCTAADLLHACFPGGSITGAPKVRAMEIIAELEPVNRGVYCGAIGYISFSGAMDTSIAIRTVTIRNGTAYFSAGGGIVADSDPEAEYQESLDKAKALIQALNRFNNPE